MNTIKVRNKYAITAHNRHGGAMVDRKKEEDRKACRGRQSIPTEYDVCNCEEAIYLKELLRKAQPYLEDSGAMDLYLEIEEAISKIG